MSSAERTRHTSEVIAATRYISRLTSIQPAVALILGSGLGDFADSLRIRVSIDTSDVPFYPKSAVPGHMGRILFCEISKGRGKALPLVVFQGRIHMYESDSVRAAVFPVDIAHMLGADTLIATNAAGAINRQLSPGDLLLIEDLISLTTVPLPPIPKEPLNRVSLDRGRRIRSKRASSFPDLKLKKLALKVAQGMRLDLPSGTYCWLKGPSYETAAEIEMLARGGVDVVGMSTVPELARGQQLGMRELALSLVSNMGTGIGVSKLSHEEVTLAGKRARKAFSGLLKGILEQLSG